MKALRPLRGLPGLPFRIPLLILRAAVDLSHTRWTGPCPLAQSRGGTSLLARFSAENNKASLSNMPKSTQE